MSKMELVVPIIKAAGVPVWETWNWTSADIDRPYTPKGVMVHHTAMSVPLSVMAAQKNNRFGGPLCNFIVRKVGQVDLVCDGYAYDSGTGSNRVLQEVISRTFPGGTARDRGIADDGTSGNPYFVDIEVDHPGNGSLLDPRAYNVLVELVAAICKVYEFDPRTQIIGHKEWTVRKVDPNWGAQYDMDSIRDDVAVKLGVPVDVPDSPEPPPVAPGGDSIPVVAQPTVTLSQMQSWASQRASTATFVGNAVKAYAESVRYGVDPAVTYAVMAHETGFGGFSGVVPASFHNWGGIKTTAGGSNTDTNAHAMFPDDTTGIRAVAQHLALYAGIVVPTDEVVDPRHFRSVFGRAKVLPASTWTWASDGPGWSERIALKVKQLRTVQP